MDRFTKMKFSIVAMIKYNIWTLTEDRKTNTISLISFAAQHTIPLYCAVAVASTLAVLFAFVACCRKRLTEDLLAERRTTKQISLKYGKTRPWRSKFATLLQSIRRNRTVLFRNARQRDLPRSRWPNPRDIARRVEIFCSSEFIPRKYISGVRPSNY